MIACEYKQFPVSSYDIFVLLQNAGWSFERYCGSYDYSINVAAYKGGFYTKAQAIAEWEEVTGLRYNKINLTHSLHFSGSEETPFQGQVAGTPSGYIDDLPRTVTMREAIQKLALALEEGGYDSQGPATAAPQVIAEAAGGVRSAPTPTPAVAPVAAPPAPATETWTPPVPDDDISARTRLIELGSGGAEAVNGVIEADSARTRLIEVD